MKRANNDQTVRRQLGVLIDEELWRKFRAAAIMQDKTATELLDEAMRKVLEEQRIEI